MILWFHLLVSDFSSSRPRPNCTCPSLRVEKSMEWLEICHVITISLATSQLPFLGLIINGEDQIVPLFVSSCRALGQEKSISLGKPMPWFRKIETKSLATYKSSKFMDLPCFQKYPKFMISFGKKSCYLRRSRILRIRDHRSLAPGVFKVSQIKVRSWSQINQVPGLVNIHKTMENHHF
jgi:hypothetical protein